LVGLLLLALFPAAGPTQAAGGLPPGLMAAPVIVSTTPADGSLQVNGSLPIEVQFSEPMNQSSFNLTTAPMVGLTVSWPTPDRVHVTPDLPFGDCTAVFVGVNNAADVNDTALAGGPVPNPWRFMTTCAQPFIVSTSPADGARNVAADADVVVTFSKPMDCLSLSVLPNPPLPPPREVQTPCTGTVYTVHMINGTRFDPVSYTWTASGQDVNGSSLVAGLAPNPWSFRVNTPPEASKPYLSAGDCIGAGTTVLVSWNMSDNESAPEELTVFLVYWNVSGWDPIAGPLLGLPSAASYLWQLPMWDLTTRIRVEVNDSSGGTATNLSDGFRVDTGPPRVVATSPVDGSVGLETDIAVAMSFSEAMNVASVESAFAASPSFPAPRFTWPVTNDSVVIDTGGLTDLTTYTVTIRASARDTCGPGRAMTQDFAFRFTTAKPRPSAPSGVIPRDVGETTVTLAWEPVTTFLAGASIPPGTTVRYLVFRSTNASVLGEPIANTTATSVTDEHLDPSTPYAYHVIAMVDGRSSPASASLVVRTRDPFFTTTEGRISIVTIASAVAGLFLVGLRVRSLRRRTEADAALTAEIREIVAQVRRVRGESDPQIRRAAEEELQSHFRSMVQGEEGEDGAPDPRLDNLYRALAQSLLESPEVNVGHGRKLVDAQLGNLALRLRREGAAYRLLSEAEASVDSELFRGLPESARKALLLVYFYALEDFLKGRLRVLVPPGSTLLLGERGHINVRRRDWQAQWAGLTLGNLLYLMDRNAHFFIEDVPRWEKEVEPLLRDAVKARNRTAHPSRQAPPLDRVRALVYGAMPAIDAVLRKSPEPKAA
ncbi:MAG TPA: Ig-like domain-containing protein, partial [Thermoplasmata archaeon]|nr:Ig-like domain-containing protein [Thermoplasmata archaeon]